MLQFGPRDVVLDSPFATTTSLLRSPTPSVRGVAVLEVAIGTASDCNRATVTRLRLLRVPGLHISRAELALAADQRLPIRNKPIQHSIQGIGILQQARRQRFDVIA